MSPGPRLESEPNALALLDNARPLYFLPQDDLAEEVLIPGFSESNSVRCMVGFFSSAALADLAPGLATYIRQSSSSLRLIISPFLSEVDRRALEEGLRSPEEIACDFLMNGLVSTENLQEHTLKCLSYLLAKARIEIRIALMRDALFHPKVWLFETPMGTLAAHGSNNMTMPGIRKNKEQITVSRSWGDPNQCYITTKLAEEFERLWRNQDGDCIVMELPSAVASKILRDYPASDPPTERDFRDLYLKAVASEFPMDNSEEVNSATAETAFTVPAFLRIDDGPYAHQGRAVQAWIEADSRGTLEMATGSGKTLTSMVAALRLYEKSKPLLIVVAAPFIPLIAQWCGEIALFGVAPTNLSSAGNAPERAQVLQQLRRKIRLGLSDVEIVVVSHDTLCTDHFKEQIESFQCEKLLIADEAHNLGRANFITSPPEFFQYRMALSATPVRQYDPEGTEAVFKFFGPVVFQFTLKDAIGTCLVEYDYYIHPIQLTPDEMEQWTDLTDLIRKNAWRQSKSKPDDYLAKLYRDRRLLLETAENKLSALSGLLDHENLRTLQHTLIYTSDKAPKQLDAVNHLLNEKHVLFRQLTAEETGDRELTRQIIRTFQQGEIQVLTAKRVLDEGVNIPQICTAYILASTTVERQWIQRRGRLLRICPEIGKTHSVIHDLLAVPPGLDYNPRGLDEDARALIRSELRRAQEFASLARNAGRQGGALEVIHKLVQASMM